MKQFVHAANKALDLLPLQMTDDLRARALDRGWAPEVVNSMWVVREEGKFVAKVGAEHAEAAFKHEFGTQSSQPTNVIRGYDSSPDTAESFFLSAFSHFLGGKK